MVKKHKQRCVNSKECDRVEKFWSDLWARMSKLPNFDVPALNLLTPAFFSFYQRWLIIGFLGRTLINLFNHHLWKYATEKRRKQMIKQPHDHAHKSCWHGLLNWPPSVWGRCTTFTLPIMHRGWIEAHCTALTAQRSWNGGDKKGKAGA